MTWTALTLDELNSMLSLTLSQYDENVRSDWERISIEPAKWQCSPWGDLGKGFWAVAVSNDNVLWYNDIEDGFNWSPYKRRGIIDEYRCSQNEFESILEDFAQVRSKQVWSDVAPGSQIPPRLISSLARLSVAHELEYKQSAPCQGLPNSAIQAPEPIHDRKKHRREKHSEDPMSLLTWLEHGTFGLSLKPDDGLTVTHADDELVQLEDSDKGVSYWLFFFRDLHMDLSAARLETFRQSAEWHARRMFITTGETDDFDGPLRTEDANWSALVDFELTDVCNAPALQTVHRMIYRPGREIMMGHLLIPVDTGLIEIRVVAADDTTGSRESAIAMMQDSMEAMEKLDPKTYDAIELDEKFPEHCLSRTRWGLQEASGWISEVQRPAPKLVQGRSTFSTLKGSFTPPLGFVHCGSDSGVEYFDRVSFCGTDGVETMVVGSESKRRVAASELLALAKSVSRKHHEDSDCEDIELTASEVAIDNAQNAVSIVLTFVGHQGPSTNLLYWFLDAKGRARSISFIDVGLGLELALDEAKTAAHSWEVARGWMQALRNKL